MGADSGEKQQAHRKRKSKSLVSVAIRIFFLGILLLVFAYVSFQNSLFRPSHPVDLQGTKKKESDEPTANLTTATTTVTAPGTGDDGVRDKVIRQTLQSQHENTDTPVKSGKTGAGVAFDQVKTEMLKSEGVPNKYTDTPADAVILDDDGDDDDEDDDEEEVMPERLQFHHRTRKNTSSTTLADSRAESSRRKGDKNESPAAKASETIVGKEETVPPHPPVPRLPASEKEEKTMDRTATSPDSRLTCTIDDRWDAQHVCEIRGQIRTHGTASTIFVLDPPADAGGNVSSVAKSREWRIKPNPRRLNDTREIVVRQLGGSSSSASAAPKCTVRHNVPAIVFALRGYTGNYWHDFTDVLIPLFAVSRQFAGEVRFLVPDFAQWFIDKYKSILRQLTRYEIINFDEDKEVRCFREAIVGLTIGPMPFDIDPETAPNGYTMDDFRRFVAEAYGLPRSHATVLPPMLGGTKPRLMVIDRKNNRRIVNIAEVMEVAEKVGFEAEALDAKSADDIAEVARRVNAVDVLVGVHGAGLTNSVFLPKMAVVMQVVPYGNLEEISRRDFGEPARHMGLRYMEYPVSAEESTLLEKYGREHPVIADPDALHRQGWWKMGEVYLVEQDVNIDVNKLFPVLSQIMSWLRSPESS